MPVVRAYIIRGSSVVTSDLLRNFCSEIIPASLNSADGPLAPGSIVFISSIVEARGMGFDVVINVKAQYYLDRARNIDERTADILRYLHEWFGSKPQFHVCVELVTAGWASDSRDTADFDGDMSLEAAYRRLNVTKN